MGYVHIYSFKFNLVTCYCVLDLGILKWSIFNQSVPTNDDIKGWHHPCEVGYLFDIQKRISNWSGFESRPMRVMLVSYRCWLCHPAYTRQHQASKLIKIKILFSQTKKRHTHTHRKETKDTYMTKSVTNL